MPLLTVLPDAVEFAVHDGETILSAVRRSGYSYHYGCRRGGCAECKAEIVSGDIVYERRIASTVLSGDERTNGVCLTCRAVPITDVALRLRQDDRLECRSHLAYAIVQPDLARLKASESKGDRPWQ